MPVGVEVVVEEGFATIDFVDGTLRGPGLAKLLAIGTPPDAIEKLTREGPRAVYVVPEGNAREAGLLDEATEFVAPADGIEKVGIELPADGTVTEVVLNGGDSPFEPLPVIENPDGTTPLEAVVGSVDAAEAVVAGDAELIAIPGGGAVESVPTGHEGTAIGDAGQESLPTGDFAPKTWPDGEPEIEWKRPELDAYASSKGLDTVELQNKAEVLAAIVKQAAEAKNS